MWFLRLRNGPRGRMKETPPSIQTQKGDTKSDEKRCQTPKDTCQRKVEVSQRPLLAMHRCWGGIKVSGWSFCEWGVWGGGVTRGGRQPTRLSDHQRPWNPTRQKWSGSTTLTLLLFVIQTFRWELWREWAEGRRRSSFSEPQSTRSGRGDERRGKHSGNMIEADGELIL